MNYVKRFWWPSSFGHGMRGETWPTWLNRPYSCEKPKPEMEFIMPTSNCSLLKNDLIDLFTDTAAILN